MKTFLISCALLASAAPCFAGPRDADAVLNRCGRPLKGDVTVLDNSVAGGHRELKYQRGDLHFDKVAMAGWTFTYGSHKHGDHLTAEEMGAVMPCLTRALADSASPEPLKTITPVERVASSAKENFKQMILWGGIAIVVIGLILLVLSRRRPEDESEEA